MYENGQQYENGMNYVQGLQQGPGSYNNPGASTPCRAVRPGRPAGRSGGAVKSGYRRRNFPARASGVTMVGVNMAVASFLP